MSKWKSCLLVQHYLKISQKFIRMMKKKILNCFNSKGKEDFLLINQSTLINKQLLTKNKKMFNLTDVFLKSCRWLSVDLRELQLPQVNLH